MALYINDEVIKKTQEMVCNHLSAHMEELEQAYIDSSESDEEPSTLNVSLSVKYKGEKGGVKITTSIRFAAKIIKEVSEIVAYPQQKTFVFNKETADALKKTSASISGKASF